MGRQARITCEELPSGLSGLCLPLPRASLPTLVCLGDNAFATVARVLQRNGTNRRYSYV